MKGRRCSLRRGGCRSPVLFTTGWRRWVCLRWSRICTCCRGSWAARRLSLGRCRCRCPRRCALLRRRQVLGTGGVTFVGSCIWWGRIRSLRRTLLCRRSTHTQFPLLFLPGCSSLPCRFASYLSTFFNRFDCSGLKIAFPWALEITISAARWPVCSFRVSDIVA